MSRSESTLTLQESYILRGLAIAAVVFLHILAYLSGIYFKSPTQWFYVGIDQLARFSVPLFIMVSGYGLAAKYGRSPLRLGEYMLARFGKLLPAYVVWSLLSILLISIIPVWSYGNQPDSILVQLMFGQADYQLYFLPVLFQLYLVFPILWLGRRFPWGILLLTLGLQLGWFLWILGQLPVPTLATLAKSERFEYVIGLSWIGYFGLGVWLQYVTLPSWVKRWSPWVMLGALMYITVSAMTAINNGLDPLFALKFTRLPILLFAVVANFTLFTWHNELRRTIGPVGRQVGEWLGQNSFVIFLSHTIALRIVATGLNEQMMWPSLLGVTMVWSAMVYVTRRWLIK